MSEIETPVEKTDDGQNVANTTTISDPQTVATGSDIPAKKTDVSIADDASSVCSQKSTVSGIPAPTASSRIARPCAGHHKPAIPSPLAATSPFNHSILTEDTDSFIIGNRVWVGGTKPGQIAYIGETQFAPGEWAGIALEQPIGKNDGSVGGIRYFQCEPKRGVFSRLTRLTRTPLAGAEEFLYPTCSTPVSNGAGVKRRVGSPMSPTGSIRSLKNPSPSLSMSNTSLASINHVIDFKVGDRVIVKSSQGSKVGTLRYMGMTAFAPGEWCGVELDEPRGRNDGSVEGHRYFDCRPQFGLFAPVTKVSKSPLKYKPGNCVIHSGAGLPPSGIMKRTNSKDSMTSSMASSFTSAVSGARRVRISTAVTSTPISSAQRQVTKTPSTGGFLTRPALQVTY